MCLFGQIIVTSNNNNRYTHYRPAQPIKSDDSLDIDIYTKLTHCVYVKHYFFPCLIEGTLSPPVIDNKEMEINGCNVNVTWISPMDTGCPLTMYMIHYREIQSGGSKDDWIRRQINQVTSTFHFMPLKCDTEYEIAMSVRDEEKESTMSNSWHVKTNSDIKGIYVYVFVIFYVFYGSPSLYLLLIFYGRKKTKLLSKISSARTK